MDVLLLVAVIVDIQLNFLSLVLLISHGLFNYYITAVYCRCVCVYVFYFFFELLQGTDIQIIKLNCTNLNVSIAWSSSST